METTATCVRCKEQGDLIEKLGRNFHVSCWEASK